MYVGMQNSITHENAFDSGHTDEKNKERPLIAWKI
jgi:hypothetical protein